MRLHLLDAGHPSSSITRLKDSSIGALSALHYTMAAEVVGVDEAQGSQ